MAVTTSYQPPPSMEDQLCRGRMVGAVCSYPLDVQVLGFPRWCRPRSAPTCVLPWATLPELYSNLRWLLVLGLEIPRRSQAVNLGWLLLVLDLGLT